MAKGIDLLRRYAPAGLRRAVARRRTSRKKARLFGALAPLVPPVESMFDGPGTLEEFKANGEEFLRIYKDLCGLRRDERMLDVGSGIGRKTLPLTQYLNAGASYEGIDVNAKGVDWCTKTITPRFPNFHFQQIDVRNQLYNPTGTCEPSEYRFPFADQSFTFITLGSVFTHMRPPEVEHYLSEIHRVLGHGRCLISYFLLNEKSRRLIDAKASALRFANPEEQWATTSPACPEEAIALDEQYVTELYRRIGLRIVRIDYGSWSGRSDYLSYQDLILAERVAN
jgi:SAM-dependent methyltransferase